MKLEHTLTPHTKINSKWLKDLKIRHDTIKLLEENTGKMFSTINCISVFFRSVSKGNTNKTKINKWDLVKLTNFCTAKEIIKKKITYGLRENSCKQWNPQGVNFQNI